MVTGLRWWALAGWLVAGPVATAQNGGFVRTNGKAAELTYTDQRQGLELFNAGGRRFPLEEGSMFRFLRSDPAPEPWGMKNGVVWNGGISGLDFGFTGHSLKGTNGNDIVLGGKWGLRRTDGTVIIPAEHDDIFPAGDLFCACKGGTVRKSWSELSDEDYEDLHGYYTSLQRAIEITKGSCALYNTRGVIVAPAQQTYALDAQHDLRNTCGEYKAGSGINFSDRTGLDEQAYAYAHAEGTNPAPMGMMCLRAPTFIYRNGGVVTSDMELRVKCTGMRPFTAGDAGGDFLPYALKPGPNGTIKVHDGIHEGRMNAELQWLLPLQYRSVVDVGYRSGTHLYVVSPVLFVDESVAGCIPDPYEADVNQWNVYSSALKRPLLPRDHASVLVAGDAIIAMLPGRNGAAGPVGLFDLTGRELAPAIFDEVQPLKGGLFALRKGTKWGLTNSKGDKLLLADHSYEAVLQKARTMR
jgi:hypothetical protein